MAQRTPNDDPVDMVEIDVRAEEIAEDTLLSQRQAEVWLLQERGLSRAAIADELGRSIHTIDEHRKRREKTRRKAKRTLDVLEGDE